MPRESIAKAAEHLSNAQTALARFLSKDRRNKDSRRSHLKIAQEEMIWAQQIVSLHPALMGSCQCGLVLHDELHFNQNCNRCSGTGII